MRPTRSLALLTLLSARAFAYSWVTAGETENPCFNADQRANFKSAFYCQRFDSVYAPWEPSWVCLTLPKNEARVKSVTLYTQTNKYFYEDVMNLKFTLPVRNKDKSLSGKQSGTPQDRQSAWDTVKLALDKQSGVLEYSDSSALPYAPEINRPYEFHFQCTNSPINTPVLGQAQILDIPNG